MRLRVVASIVISLGLAGSGCTANHGAIQPPARSGAARSGVAAVPAPLYVAVGAAESRGDGTDNPLAQAWPQVFFRKTLPREYIFVNFSSQGATVAGALDIQLPQALALHPTLATVWLNVDDLLGATAIDRYRADLTALVHGLRSSGSAVLLANTPPIEGLPAYIACSDPSHRSGGCPAFIPRPVVAPIAVADAVAAYNAVIATVAAREGAVLVDLFSAAQGARGTAESLVSPDGFHPSAAGAEAIAAQFGAAWRPRP